MRLACQTWTNFAELIFAISKYYKDNFRGCTSIVPDFILNNSIFRSLLIFTMVAKKKHPFFKMSTWMFICKKWFWKKVDPARNSYWTWAFLQVPMYVYHANSRLYFRKTRKSQKTIIISDNFRGIYFQNLRQLLDIALRLNIINTNNTISTLIYMAAKIVIVRLGTVSKLTLNLNKLKQTFNSLDKIV